MSPEANKSATLVGRLFHYAEERPDAVALRDKRLGIWHEVTWSQYARNVGRVAAALEKAGVGTGDSVSILSENRPEWLYADLATQLLGARSVGIYQTNPPEDVAYVLSDSGSCVLFAEDQEQVDKAVEIAGDTPSVRRVVVFDDRGTRSIEDQRLIKWEDFLAEGDEADDEWLREKLAAVDPAQPAMIVYTSGTTGPPKGAMISPANVLETSEAVNETLKLTADDVILSYLPLCHIAEKIFSLFVPMTVGAVVHFGESIATVQADLREVSPTVFLGVPRIWEKMHSSVQVKMQDSSLLKRSLYRWAEKVGASLGEKKRQGRLSPAESARWQVAALLVFRPLKERLGLARCRVPISGAAPIGEEILHWYHGIDLPVLEGYGMTESAGVSHINPPDSVRIGTVGKAVPLVECELAEDGEVLLRGPNVFCGYLNRPEATADTIDAEGWLHTGDVGSIDEDGFLRITGRKKEIIITSGGKNLSPEKIENALKSSPYIKEAVAIGDQRKFVSALIQIDFDTVSDWASRRSLTHTSFADLSAKGEVEELVDAELQRINEGLVRVESVRQFRLLSKELSQDDGELTATQKVRRRQVMEINAALIESIYGASGA